MSALVRRAILVVATAGLAVVPTSARAQFNPSAPSPHAVYEFVDPPATVEDEALEPAYYGDLDLTALTTEFVFNPPLPLIDEVATPSANIAVALPGVAGNRNVRSIPAGGGLTVPAGGLPGPMWTGPGDEWTVSALVRVTDTATETDLMSFGEGMAGRLVVDQGQVVWDTGAATEELGAIADDDWTTVTVGFEAGDMTVTVGDELPETVADADDDLGDNALTLFGAGTSAAQIARLRTFRGTFDDATIESFGDPDLEAPAPRPGDGPDGLAPAVWDDGVDDWLGPNWGLAALLTDETTSPVAAAATVRTPGGATVWGPAPLDVAPFLSGGAKLIASTLGVPPAMAAELADGQEYDLELGAADVHGQGATYAARRIRWDDTPPALTLDAFPDRVTRMPRFGGQAGSADSDAPVVFGSICTSDPCTFGPVTNEVAYFEPVSAGGEWDADEVWESCSCAVIDDLPRGSYHLEVEQYDLLNNVKRIERDFRIVDPSELVDPPPAGGGGGGRDTAPIPIPAPPVPAPFLSGIPTRPATAAELATRLLRSALTAFRQESVRKFVRDGASFRFTAPRAGRARIDVFDSAKARKPIATGSAAFTRAGAVTLKVRLTKAGKAKLRRKRSARLTVRATFVPAGTRGAATSGTAPLKR